MSGHNSQYRNGRRDFFRLLTLGGLGVVLSPLAKSSPVSVFELTEQDKPSTNISDALKYARKPISMPGFFPGKVIRTEHSNCIRDYIPVPEAVNEMLKQSILSLTGERNLKKAWRTFVSPKDIIGLKINSAEGKHLSTNHDLINALIKQLTHSGIPLRNIVIWDRNEDQLKETGFTSAQYPGLRIMGTEQKDKEGSFYDKEGKLYGEKMIDPEWYYWADVEGHYDRNTIPYMINEGKYSYFTKICTKEVTKIINLPVLKNAGHSVALCLENLAFGSITNTGRLYGKFWHEACAEVCAFPPLRDKVVLNIADGLFGCYKGSPSFNPQYITPFRLLLVGTDPVAVDRIGLDIITAKRIEFRLQKEENPNASMFLKFAEDLGLGVADRNKIDVSEINLS
ncbi:MAG: DUF362 domain-containing protein [Bacteroidota bacterium]|nr:DUF362 domain-containing protein [Bacteroidota bacterium]